MINRILIILLITSKLGFCSSKMDTVFFSKPSGFYTESFKLILTNTDNKEIHYSLDGTYPKTKYQGPLTISKSATIRVRNSGSSKGITQNFIFHPRSVSLPILAITIDPFDLYDSVNGMYVKGLNAEEEPPYKGANFHKELEKLAYVELINTKNIVEFNQRIGLKIFGQYSAMLPQKSFSVHARKIYGDNKIRSKLFPDLPYKKYKSFVVRNSGSDFCNAHYRDILMSSLVNNMNIDNQAYRTCIVYINGKYWGVYHLREKINEFYLSQHYKIDKDSVAIVRHNSEVQHYGRLNYNEMLSFLRKNSFESNQMIDSLATLMDIDNYLDYNIAQVYSNNIDAGGNIRYWRGIQPGSKWRWILFDTDFGFGLRPGNGVEENTLKNFTTNSTESWPNPAWSTLIIRKLLENDSIKQIYIKKMCWNLNTTFSPESVLERIEKIEKRLEPEMKFHFDRWDRSYNIWKTQSKIIKEFAAKRPTFVFLHLKEKFNLSPYYSLSVNIEGNNKLSADGVILQTGRTYTLPSEIKMNIEIIPQFGYEFDSWGVDSVIEGRLSLTKDTELKPEFRRKANSKYKNILTINEIAWKDTVNSDYIEFYNNSNIAINLSGWVLLRDGKKKFIFDNGWKIGAKSYFTISKKKIAQESSTLKNGLFSIKSNSRIELFTNNEEFVDAIYLNEKKGKKVGRKERVYSVIEKGWFDSEESSINKVNKRQIKSAQKNFYILSGFLLLSSVTIISIVIFNYRQKKRLHSSTE